MLTVQEIQQQFVDYFVKAENIDPEDTFEDIWHEYVHETLEMLDYRKDKPWFLPSGQVKLIEDFGGEGLGEVRYIIFSVGDRIFRVNGYYASWDGTTWEDPTPEEVVAKEVMKVEYVTKETNV